MPSVWSTVSASYADANEDGDKDDNGKDEGSHHDQLR